MEIETQLVRFPACPGDPHRATSTPIYQTATFAQTGAVGFGNYDYSRSGNPTRTVLEDQLARLEKGACARTFASGMAALAAVAGLVEAGDAILAGDDLYGGTYRLLSQIVSRRGVEVFSVDTTDLEALSQVLRSHDNIKLVLIETPTNPLQRVVDIRAVADRVHAHGALLAVDNTLLSPYLQQPLSLGADLVIHSATKFLGGHADLTAGAVIARDQELGGRIAFIQNAEGTGLGPFDAWLLLRGMKTLGVRMAQQERSARRLASYLESHPKIKKVHYPGLKSHAGHELLASQSSGFGALISFETGDFELSKKLVEDTELFTIAVSFGSVNSTISLPGAMSHASIPAEVRKARGLPEDLIRVSVGLESIDDLIADLDACLSYHESPITKKAVCAGIP